MLPSTFFSSLLSQVLPRDVVVAAGGCEGQGAGKRNVAATGVSS